jgi:hypothetical protein
MVVCEVVFRFCRRMTIRSVMWVIRACDHGTSTDRELKILFKLKDGTKRFVGDCASRSTAPSLRRS